MNRSAIQDWSQWLARVGLLLAVPNLAIAATSGPITQLSIFAVPPRHAQSFDQGIERWERCLRARGETETIEGYRAQTGDLGRFLILVPHRSWADMDRSDPAAKACATSFKRNVLPNSSDIRREFWQQDPRLSWMPGSNSGPAPMLQIDAYRIKAAKESSFKAVFRKFVAAAAKIHWQEHFLGLDVYASGRDGENFVLLAPEEAWASAGLQPKPSVPDMMRGVYGLASARAMHREFVGSLVDEWSDIWRYEKSESYIPAR